MIFLKSAPDYKRVSLILLIILALTSLACAQAPGNQSDVEWIIEVLDIQKGSVVADIGAGDGDQTLAIAEHVGGQGTVYSTEIGEDQLAELNKAVENSSLSNITVLEAHPKRTNLPEQCCNAIYLRRVYHHITNPDDFNSSLYQSLKSDGKLAIIDFEPRGSEADPGSRSSGNSHGVTVKTVVKELGQAGFEKVSTQTKSGRNIYVVMKKSSKSTQ